MINQDEEFLFTCELCGDRFPAHPDTMLECKADFRVTDPETGHSFEIPKDMEADFLASVKENPEIRPFLKGVICVCLKCQDAWEADMNISMEHIVDPENPSV